MTSDGERPTAHPRTLLVFGREALALRGIYASGGVGFLQDMLVVAGGDNVFADVKRQSVQATAELVLARQPEVILELRGTSLTAEMRRKEISVWQSLSAVPAVKSERIAFIADQRTSCRGPALPRAPNCSPARCTPRRSSEDSRFLEQRQRQRLDAARVAQGSALANLPRC